MEHVRKKKFLAMESVGQDGNCVDLNQTHVIGKEVQAPGNVMINVFQNQNLATMNARQTLYYAMGHVSLNGSITNVVISACQMVNHVMKLVLKITCWWMESAHIMCGNVAMNIFQIHLHVIGHVLQTKYIAMDFAIQIVLIKTAMAHAWDTQSSVMEHVMKNKDISITT